MAPREDEGKADLATGRTARLRVAKEGRLGIFFIAGRQKSDPGTDFSDANVAQAQIIGEALQDASIKSLDAMINEGVLREVCHGCQES